MSSKSDKTLHISKSDCQCIQHHYVEPCSLQALRVSMEENRARQEEEARKVAKDSALEAGVTVPGEGITTVKILQTRRCT